MSTSNSATFITHAPTPGVPIAAGGGPPGDGEGGGGGEGGGPPGLGLPAPVVPVVPIFALSPALINNNVIDYATPEGIKLYKQAVSPLPITYNGTGNSLHLFLTTVQERAAVSNWSDVLTIPDANGMPRDLLLQYGQLTIEDIRMHATTYVGQPVRMAQNSASLFQCISASITEDAKTRVMTSAESYYVAGQANGPLFLKVIIATAHVDTRATASHIRNNLSRLDVYMISIESDIESFNQYVKTQRKGLAARGETSNDLLINLFKGYKAASDRQFVEYIHKKQDSYDEGDALSEDRLMLLALNKYRNMMQTNQWNAPSREEEQIIALSAQVQELKKTASTLNRKKAKPKTDRSKNPPRTKRSNEDKFAWKLIPPKAGEERTKQVNEKTYHWCKKHKAWTLHSPQECRLKEESSNEDEGGLQMDQAMTGILESDSEYDSQEEEEDK
jgi:hypothetical protein